MVAGPVRRRRRRALVGLLLATAIIAVGYGAASADGALTITPAPAHAPPAARQSDPADSFSWHQVPSTGVSCQENEW